MDVSMKPAGALDIRMLVTDALNAPSGDNAQPWRFAIENGTLLIYKVPGADPTLYDYRERGTYLAHGALVENISICAARRGYRAGIALFPGEPDCTARISFSRADGVEDELLAHAIPARTTNRKPYHKIALRADHRAALETAIPGTDLRLVEAPTARALLAHAVSTNERLLMEERQLHDGLFGMIRWSRQAEREMPGLYVETMELPPPVRFLFRHVVRHWPLLSILNLAGFSRMIPAQTAPVYEASSAFGAIVSTGYDAADFVVSGRAFERLWLTATRVGLSLQPTTAIPYLMQRIAGGDAEMFSPKHRALIQEAYGVMEKTFNLVGSEHIVMLFRVGYGDPPTAHSWKRPPVFVDA